MTYRSDIESLAARKVALDGEIERRTKERDEAEQILKDAVERLRLPLIDNVVIAAPCKANWSNMTGDERVRHCTRCDQQVFDLSAMTRDEAETLIREKNGKLCARYYKRADGTVMTKDCPEGRRKRRRLVTIAAGTIATAVVAGGALASKRQVAMGSIGALPPVLPEACEQYRADISALRDCNGVRPEATETLEGAWNYLDYVARGLDIKPEQLEKLAARCDRGREELARMREAVCAPTVPRADSQ